LLQVDRLHCALWSRDPWQSLTLEYPDLQEIKAVLAGKPDGFTGAHIEANLMGLYRRYCEEWVNFPAHPPGWRFSLLESHLAA
jgi:hypothetical protein